MPLKEIEVAETPHNMDGLLLHGWDGSEGVEAFISRRVALHRACRLPNGRHAVSLVQRSLVQENRLRHPSLQVGEDGLAVHRRQADRNT